jgi:demethylmenaquinone methyltransferase/2-methoxy-6-polyprenyl-1,4-benzoquinol methylase
MFYLNKIIPIIGRLFLGNPVCYRMLGAYTEAFGNARHFAECLREAGLKAVLVSYFFGCATGVRGFKPALGL